MGKIIHFKRPYTSIYGAPSIDRFDDEIFSFTYFVRCMECDYCNDVCCSYGVDIDLENVKRIESQKQAIEKYIKKDIGKALTKEIVDDVEFPGGKYTRTAIEGGKCFFLSKESRGCSIHSFCIDQNIDYHTLKPIVSCLFPLTFDNGLLHASDEIIDSELVCQGNGLSLYRGIRDEILYYFGAECVGELDDCEVLV